MATRVNNEWGIIRHPESQGAIIAKLGNYPLIPDDVAEHDDFVIQSVPNASAITDHEIDRSGLSDDELDLINQVQYVDQS